MLYRATVAKYTTLFFEHLTSLLRLASKYPYPCDQSMRLLDAVDAVSKLPDKHDQVLDEFYECVRPIADRLVAYVGSMREKQRNEMLCGEVMQQIQAAQEAGHDDDWLVEHRLRAPDGQYVARGQLRLRRHQWLRLRAK